MGSLSSLLGMIPGIPRQKELKGLQVDDKALDHIQAIIFSMTPEERRHPEVIDGSRRQRIARGSGTQVQDVNQLLKQFQRDAEDDEDVLQRQDEGPQAARDAGRLTAR